MGHFLHLLLREWAQLPITSAQDEERFLQEAGSLREAVNTHGWDGNGIVRATTDSGERGRQRLEHGGPHLPQRSNLGCHNGHRRPQPRRAGDGRSPRAPVQRVRPLLLAPAYSVPNSSVGYLSRYAPGTRENGGLYTHAGTWAIIAEGMHMGRGAPTTCGAPSARYCAGKNPTHTSPSHTSPPATWMDLHRASLAGEAGPGTVALHSGICGR